MARYILRFRGAGNTPEADVARVCALPNAHVIDSTPQMLLVDGPEEALRDAVGAEWVIVPERQVENPTRRRSLLKRSKR